MAPTDPTKINKVVVHPLVLLSVVDHFNRMGKVGNVKRTVGVLLGANRQGILDVSNSYAGLVNLIFNKNVVWLVSSKPGAFIPFVVLPLPPKFGHPQLCKTKACYVWFVE